MRILVPVDGSTPADDALAYALEQFAADEIVALYVMDPVDGATAWGPGSADDWLQAAEERSERVLEAATALASDAGVEVTTDSTVGRPAHAIVEYVKDHDVEHVVIGSHGRGGLSRVLLGSVAEVVVRRAPVPVTVVRSS